MWGITLLVIDVRLTGLAGDPRRSALCLSFLAEYPYSGKSPGDLPINVEWTESPLLDQTIPLPPAYHVRPHTISSRASTRQPPLGGQGQAFLDAGRGAA